MIVGKRKRIIGKTNIEAVIGIGIELRAQVVTDIKSVDCIVIGKTIQRIVRGVEAKVVVIVDIVLAERPFNNRLDIRYNYHVARVNRKFTYS